jgi:hypothetical protein
MRLCPTDARKLTGPRGATNVALNEMRQNLGDVDPGHVGRERDRVVRLLQKATNCVGSVR